VSDIVEVNEQVNDKGTKKKGLSLTHILSLLENGLTQSDIAQEFQCSKANICQRIKKATQDGLIQREPYSIGNIGLITDKNKVNEAHIGDVLPFSNDNKLEIHHIDFKFKILKDTAKFVISEPIQLKNGASYQLYQLPNGLVIRKYANGSLIMQGIRVESDRYANAIAKATSSALDVKAYLEKRFGIILNKNPEITKLPDIVPKLPQELRGSVMDIARQGKVEARDGFTIDESEGEGKGHMEFKLAKLEPSKQKEAIKKAELMANIPELLNFLVEQQFVFSMNLKQHLEVLTKMSDSLDLINTTLKELKP
jgi:predicted DNA-binding transcriptional regulator